MPVWLTWLVALGVLVLESALLSAFGVDGWALQTAVALTIFLALRRDFVSGAVVLAALLVPIEWLVVAPPGHYALSLVVVFFVLQLARGNIQSEWGLSQAVLAMFTVVLQTGMMALGMVVVEPHAGIMEALLWGAVPGAVGAALVVWPLGVVLTRIDRMVDPHSGRRMKMYS
jgi:ABC-type cobalt transport system substrate-binding protein